ncbi:helix-turn-helix domain-containing protein [Streptococcus pneumoniae]|uniref:helix-turn-helix domain-containing protein n=1 Tax=Streptococcus pneumoniae TaxID=1313 RepID=UPI00032826F5|nr:helix-turn-helix transcriptional regulator [Streptococcus pneumoniae]EOB18010.1 phage transcriptional regulator, Cro/CI family protein [Streptococcus pneumoniae 801]MDA2878809.1 helix-turn-helix transcriptional regulator [Streptococcus pneumoniae]MDG8938419.1 helix-turn-helix transcriptional regulator [Streptococcus pneumoniae]MDS2484403.1 helix-turn-helix transcriptional regulator [Streptococcus pneumoniae]MDS2491600.1 helix-turn-helix transcriptional regulator [Streptococcus pneumoniae]
MFSLFEKIKELCQNRGISINSLEETLGYSRNTIYSMKNKKPNAERLQEIADYFNVSTDYLLGRTDNPAIAGSDEFAQVNGQIIDLRKAAANTMLFDGKPLNEDDIDFITSVLSAHFKSKGER